MAFPTLSIVIAYLEFLVKNQVSVSMIANHVSAVKAHFIIYGLPFQILEHPLTCVVRNITSLEDLKALFAHCTFIPHGGVSKSIFLTAFFGFFIFDATRHLTLHDITFKFDCMQIAVKWSKTLQTRDRIHLVTLPRLPGSPLCPVKALKKSRSYITHIQIPHFFGSRPLLDGW